MGRGQSAETSRAHAHECAVDDALDGGAGGAVEIRGTENVGKVIVRVGGIQGGYEVGKGAPGADLT